MRNLLLGVLLGLLAVVHSTPINTVTQIPARLEEDIYNEVKAEELILDPFTPQSVSSTPTTTESVLDGKIASPRTEPRQTLVVFQESQQLPSDTTNEGSGESQTTPLSVSDNPSTQSVMVRLSTLQASDQSLTHFTTEGSADSTSSTQLFQESGFFPTAALNAAASTSTMASTVAVDTTIETTQQTFTDYFTEGSGKEGGSGLSSTTTLIPASVMKLVKDNAVASTSEPPQISPIIQDVVEQTNRRRSFLKNENNGGTEKFSDVKEFINGPDHPETGMHRGHSTPDWIIIVAFIVALAALLAVCAAIATRDKWNHPEQVPEILSNSSNQKRELEMQPFVHKTEPKVNGNNGDYAGIPQDDAL